MATEADVRRIATALPGAYEQATYDDAPSFRTPPRMFTWIRSDAGVEGEPTVVLWVATEEDKHALIATDPRVYFTVGHYDGSPIVLARLAAIDQTELAEMITESYRLRAPKKLVAELDAG